MSRLYSNYHNMVDKVQADMLGVTLVERLPARNSAEAEEHDRLDDEDQPKNWLQDEAPLPF